jgi:hypothetical protein
MVCPSDMKVFVLCRQLSEKLEMHEFEASKPTYQPSKMSVLATCRKACKGIYTLDSAPSCSGTSWTKWNFCTVFQGLFL